MRQLSLQFVFLSLTFFSFSTAAATFNGPWVQGAMVTGKAEPGETIIFSGRELRVAGDGKFVFGLGRDAGPTVEVTVSSADGAKELFSFEVSQREYQIQRIEGIKKKHVSPPDSVLARIKAEAAAVRAARTVDDPRVDFLSNYIWPVKGRVTGVYGSQRFYNGVPKSPHYGIDIAAPADTPVLAPAAGVVTFANEDLYYSGGTLIVDHGHGISSTFIHLNKIEVAVGDEVKQGQFIARVGSTGRSTGPHLDWRMNWFGVRIDPQLLFPEGSEPQ